MASKEEMFNLSACREVLRYFSLSDTKTSVDQNTTWVLDAKRRSIKQMIEEEQTHRVQVTAFSQMQL